VKKLTTIQRAGNGLRFEFHRENQTTNGTTELCNNNLSLSLKPKMSCLLKRMQKNVRNEKKFLRKQIYHLLSKFINFLADHLFGMQNHHGKLWKSIRVQDSLP
jgi:hypothetical protein